MTYYFILFLYLSLISWGKICFLPVISDFESWSFLELPEDLKKKKCLWGGRWALWPHTGAGADSHAALEAVRTPAASLPASLAMLPILVFSQPVLTLELRGLTPSQPARLWEQSHGKFWKLTINLVREEKWKTTSSFHQNVSSPKCASVEEALWPPWNKLFYLLIIFSKCGLWELPILISLAAEVGQEMHRGKNSSVKNADSFSPPQR